MSLEIPIKDIQEICAGDGIEKAFAELNISATKKYDDGDYEIWWLSKNDYQKLNNVLEDDWKEKWGWWRSSKGSNISDFPRHYFNVNGKQLLGYYDKENLNDFIENYSEDGVITEDLTESYFDNKYSNLREYLCQELGVSTATNVCAVTMDIAKLNHLTLADLFIQYEGRNKELVNSYCKVCCNATVEPELTSKNDLSYINVGESIRGVNMYIKTGANRPTSLIVSQWNKTLEENVNIGIYKMKFCPECGRKLIENDNK